MPSFLLALSRRLCETASFLFEKRRKSGTTSDLHAPVLREGALSQMENNKRKDSYVYLFEDKLFCTKRRKKDQHSFETIIQKMKSVEPCVGKENAFKVVAEGSKGKTKVFHFVAPTGAERSQWIRDIETVTNSDFLFGGK